MNDDKFRRDFKGCQLSHTLQINESPDDEYVRHNKLDGVWYMSEKYDGLRAVWTGKDLITRTMKTFAYVPDWFRSKLGRTPFDGEIYIPNEPFTSLSISKKCDIIDNRWKKVKYLIFDTPMKNIKFEQRLKFLRTLKFECDFIQVINFQEVNLPREFGKVNEMFREVVARNGEGVMLIRASSGYEEGKRSKDSLKYKKDTEGQATIVSFHEGLGKYKGKLGKFKCRMPSGNTFFCGTGIDDELRDKYVFDKTVCVSAQDDAPKIGDAIRFSCLEIIDKTGIPRLGVYKGLM